MFFNKFPTVDYDIKRKGKTQKMVDTFRAVRPLQNFVDNFTGYRLYEIINGERPDIVSQRLYGTPRFYWTFFVINDILHDGYRAWPMSQEDLSQYIEKVYAGVAITTNPKTAVTSFSSNNNQDDSLAGRFSVGKTLHGTKSGAKGRIVKKNIDMNQLIVQDVVLGTAGQNGITGASDSSIIGGNFIGDPLLNPGSEQIQQFDGVTPSAGDLVNTYRVYDYASAPYKFFKTNDVNKNAVDNSEHILGAEAATGISFQTYRDYEIELNDARSSIKYVDPNFIEQFVSGFEELINE